MASGKTALISVFDKTGVENFAKGLVGLGYEVISSGGTAAFLKKHGVQVIEVSDYTETQELFDGRVKTLHPKIHAGILYRRGLKKDEEETTKHGIRSIDIVAVNFYPFKKTIESGERNVRKIIEDIDIGGPSLVRAAAKNFEHVTVVVSPSDYESVLKNLQENSLTKEKRMELASKAFAQTACFDARVHAFFAKELKQDFPDKLITCFDKTQDLRYGENPHQRAALYSDGSQGFASLAGKQLSYNNVLDADAALALAKEFRGEKTAVIIKHLNPCGGATGKTLREAFEKALATDPLSAYGGIVAFTQKVDVDTAHALADQFIEVILAPGYEKKAFEILSEKKNRRILDSTELMNAQKTKEIRTVLGGVLHQDYDSLLLDEKNWRIVTKRHPTEQEKKALLFAWKFAKHVKSNAVVFTTDSQVIGIGAGQMSRVDSCKIAVEKASISGLEIRGTVMASDAFFPFRDTVDFAGKAGATAIIHPGGSKRDEEVIQAANEHNMAMVFTGVRHFKH